MDAPMRDAAMMKRRRRRWTVLGISAVAVAALAAAGALVLHRSPGDPRTAPAPPPSSSRTQSAAPPGSPPTQSPRPSAGARSGPVGPAFGYLMLWPFGSLSEAASWQRDDPAGVHQPWHLDAGLTARAFTQNYLGFATVDRVVGATAAGDEAWVQVGYRTAGGTDITAATIHLARTGTGARRPWEVVGTRDADLSIGTPGYGATVTSPMTVGGRITGVNERLSVQVRALGTDRPVGEATVVPAGGSSQPWRATVSLRPATGGTRTIVVSTLSHVGVGIGRFAITGIRVSDDG